MNYIPGFSNHLQTSVPRYAIGGRVMDDERMMYRNEPMFGDEYNMFGGEMMLPPMDQYAQPMMYGDPMAAAAPVMDTYQQAAVEPVTQEVAPAEVPFDPSTFDFSGLDLSGLDSLYGMNFGSNFGGGPMGGIYQADPNIQYIGAPKSNKGNATSQTGGNTFAVRADQPVRLVDHRTNQIVFEGTGFDAARKATELGQGLTNQFGRKANYSIQTADPTGNYSTVAYEKKNKSTLGKIAGAVGTALPLATMFIPGLNVLGTIAAGAGLGGAGAALRGDDILKGVAMGGLSAAGGQVLGPALEAGGKFGTALAPKLATAVGTGIGSTAGGLVTGQDLKSSLLSGVASGALSYVAPTIANELGIKPINLNGTKGTSGSSGMTADGGLQVTASTLGTPSIGYTLGGSSPSKLKLPETTGPETPYDGLSVTGSRLGGLSAVNLGGNQFGAPGEDVSAFDRLTDTADPNEVVVDATTRTTPVSGGFTLSPDVLAGIAEFEKNPIISEGSKIEQPTGGLTLSPDVLAGIAEFEKNPIISEGSKIEQPTGGLTVAQNPVVDGVDQVTKEIVATAPKVEQPTTAVPAAGDGFRLEPEVLSEVDKLSEAEKEGKKDRKLGLEEYLRIAGLLSGLVGGAAGGGQGQTGTYGGGGTGRLNPIFSAKLPTAGGLGSVGVNRTVRPMGDVDWLTYGQRPELNFYDYAARSNPAPVTTPVPNNPAGPSMYVPDNMRFAEGGAFAAKRGGPSQRTEFAVNGPGTGRSDDIPAVLSDGEYVIDAETVALLGDGSSKAGAKKLDELRVKVRKHKGQKLAKGRFSANAKKPEAYLSGGRI
jgi:hypothetical protein